MPKPASRVAKVGFSKRLTLVRPTGSVHSWRVSHAQTRVSHTKNATRRNFDLRPHRSKMLGQEIPDWPEGPRGGFEYDCRDPSMTKVLGVLRTASRVP